ncbi:MAG: ATP-dependent Clp protease adaptor ClpS [Myxococcota bacterium]
MSWQVYRRNPGNPGETTREKQAPPEDDLSEVPLYRVLLHNDPFTRREYVVVILREIFHKNARDAQRIMLQAHLGGQSLVDVLPAEEAALRVARAHQRARQDGYPLTFSFEPDV